MRFSFIRDHADIFSVKKMCQVLEVSRSGYYAWLNRPTSQREQANEFLLENIRRVYHKSRGLYGYPRVTAQLQEEAIQCSRNRVARLMRKHDIKARTKRKFRATTNSNHQYPVAPNVVNRNFATDGPDKHWYVDITYLPTDEGWLYLAIVLDSYSRAIVGWSMDKTITKQLAINALKHAIHDRRPTPGLIHHSDRGSQYASHEYQELLRENGFITSMSRKGDCWDNACAESFFHTLKTELVYFYRYKTRAEAKLSVFEYIEVFYNRYRLHSSLGYKSPYSYENQSKVA